MLAPHWNSHPEATRVTHQISVQLERKNSHRGQESACPNAANRRRQQRAQWFARATSDRVRWISAAFSSASVAAYSKRRVVVVG